MSKTTTVNALPFPEDKDNPNGPLQIEELAKVLDTLKWGSRNLKPTAGLVKISSGKLEVGNTFEDAGAKLEITPAVASKLILVSFMEFESEGEGVTGGESSVKIDSESESEQRAVWSTPASTVVRATITMPYLLTLTAEAHTIKLRVRRTAGSSAKLKLGANSGFFYWLAAS